MEIRALEGLLKSRVQPERAQRGDFAQELGKLIQWANREQQKSEAIKEAVLKGADVPLHQMIIEFEKASVSLNLLIQVRNKLLEAYQEIMRLQV